MERGVGYDEAKTQRLIVLNGRPRFLLLCILFAAVLLPSGLPASDGDGKAPLFSVTIDPPPAPASQSTANSANGSSSTMTPSEIPVPTENQTGQGRMPSNSEPRSIMTQDRVGTEGALPVQSPGTPGTAAADRQTTPPGPGTSPVPQTSGQQAQIPAGRPQTGAQQSISGPVEQPVQQQPSQPPPPARSRPAASANSSRSAGQGGPVSFNFDDADVYSVIQTVFGDLLRVNYVVDPKVKGRVTFRSVAPVPRENVLPVMEVILRLNGIGIVEEAGIFRIIQITDIAKEPAPIQYGRNPEKISVTGKSLLQVVPILNIQSTEIVKLIASFVSTNAVLIDIPRGNHIIIVDTDANVRRLLELVQIFDGDQFKKRKGEVYVYQVQNSKAKDVAALLQQIFLGGSQSSTGSTTSRSAPSPTPAGPATPQTAIQQVPTIVGGGNTLVSDITRIFPDEIINSVIVVGTPEDYAVIKEAIQKIDVIRRQVVLEGVIAEVTLTDNLSLGLAYSLNVTMNTLGLKTQMGLNPGILSSNSGSGSTDSPTLGGSGFRFIGVDNGGTVRAFVSALAAESKGKLLAAPSILVADNREARIQVGQQVPIVTSETIASAGVPAQQTVQYKDIGIILKVKPQVNESGLVSLEIDQEVSSFTTQQLFTNSTQIIVDKIQATTNLVVSEGQTIVIGGLIREDTNRTASGIPFLHKIPVLGYLFGQKSRDTTRKELIILLTPHVIKNQDQAKDVTKTYIDKFSSLGTVKKEDLTYGGGSTLGPGIKGDK